MATSYIPHVTTEGERWDQLADRYYADPTDYERIIAANPQLRIMLKLPAGVVLSIPIIEPDDSTAEDLPPWLT